MPKDTGSPVLAIPQLPELAVESVKGIVDELPWMNECKLTLLYKRNDIVKFIDRCIEKGLAAFDIETTGLNTREHPEKISSSPLVGVSIAISRYEAVYIAIAHEDSEYNVNLDFIVSEIKRLSANCCLIFHNFKYDGQVLRNYGIKVGGEQCDPLSFEDTILLTTIYDSSRRDKRLKPLSKEILGREMLNIKSLGVSVNDKSVPAFDQVPPEKAVYYAASDTLCTYYLYERLTELINQQDPNGNAGPWGIYNKIEKPCLFVTMEMERNYVLVNKDYLIEIRETLRSKCKECIQIAYEAAGRPFDVASPKQLGVILFEELKLPYHGKNIKETKSKSYETSSEILEQIKDKHPIVSAILDYRHYEKQLTTYVENLINNADENNMVKFELNQFKADTGRFTATGGKGLLIDGYCGVNCQNLPRPKKKDPKSFDIRKALIARPGFKIVTIDYSGEELRIAANLSGEKKWINEFVHGTGDLHTITGQVITGKKDISKEERGLGKCVVRGTLIATVDGWRPIEDLKKGDLVITSSGDLYPIEKVWDMGKKPGITIETTSGQKITCGLNHRFKTPDGEWVRAEDLKKNQVILTASCEKIDPKEKIRIPFNFWKKGMVEKSEGQLLPEVEIDEKWGKLLGYLLGDGSIHPHWVGMVCSSQYEDVKDDIVRLAEELGFPCTVNLSKKSKPQKTPLYVIHFGSTILSRFMKEVGFRGRRKKVFRVPRCIFESPKPVAAAFLRGLFETDGTVDGLVSLCTKDIELAQDVILLLASFGIKAYKYDKPSKKYKRTYYQVQMGKAASKLFQDHIGFISERKKDKLAKLCAKKDSIKHQKNAWETKVKVIKKHDSVDLMDLTINTDHTYIAQGLVTHNTLNFLTLYGGGAGGFAAQAKITMDRAKKMIQNFFKQYTGISAWIKREIAKGRKRGYSTTALGRRRPLAYFYQSGDKFMASKGDRCVINSSVQGCLQPQERCLTSKGYLSVTDIKYRKNFGEDMRVWTGSSWEEFEVLDRGVCQYAYLELENGLKLDCDTRHEVLTVGKSGYVFTKFEDLTKDSLICSPIPRPLEFGRYPDQDFFSGGTAHNSKDIHLSDASDYEFIAFVLGIATGDGNLRIGDRNSLTVSFGKKKLSEYYEKLKAGFEKIGLQISTPRKTRGAKGESYQATVESKALVNLFSYYGFEVADSKTKRVPHRIYTCPLNMRKAYLRGCFMSDGSRSAENRYGIHTPNKKLLQDIQLIGLHLGLAAYVRQNGDNTYTLHWSDLSRAESVLGLPVSKRKVYGKMLLPSFMYEKVYKLLKEDGRYTKSAKDTALVCKLKKRRKITVQTAVNLLEKYNCPTLSEFYYHYKLKDKIVLPEKSNTYTLSVYSDLHRFDSAGIISKNTGADIIKIALRRVSNYIRENGLSDKIRILMPIHDEIVYEIANDGTPEGEAAFGKYIEDLAEIMKIDDVITALKWPVHLEVDAEYGDSLSITNDYFKEKEAALKEHQPSEQEKIEEKPQVSADGSDNNFSKLPEPPVQEEESNEGSAEHVSSIVRSTLEKEGKEIIKDIQKKEYVNDSTDVRVESTEHRQEDGLAICFKALVSKRMEEVNQFSDGREDLFLEQAQEDNTLKDFVDKRGFFEWPVSNCSDVALSQLTATFRTLKKLDPLFSGPKYRVKLVSKNGEVLYKSQKKVSVDAFLFAIVWLNI